MAAPRLTPRETQVRRLLRSYGMGEVKIYQRLSHDMFITESRARAYVASIRQKERARDEQSDHRVGYPSGSDPPR